MLILYVLGLMICIDPVLSYRSDLSILAATVSGIRRELLESTRASRVGMVKQSEPKSSLARRALTELSLIKNSLADSSWRELNRAEDESVLPIPELGSAALKELGEDEFYALLCRSVTNKFRSKVVAIAVSNAGDQARIFAEGVSIKRIAPYLENNFREYFKTGNKSVFGLQDSFDSNEIFGGCASYGCRYSLALPFTPLNGERAVLWLGYQYSAPTSLEIRWVNALVKKIGSEVRTRKQLVSLYDEIKESGKVDHKFIATLSHDIRTPLNTLKNSLTLAKLEGRSIDHPQLHDSLLEQCEHASGMVEDLLDYSRCRFGKIEAHREPIKIDQTLESIVGSFEGQAAERCVELILEQGVALEVEFDRKQLRRILGNLIDNAIKYSAGGGEVRVRAIVSGENIKISVLDNGRGFSKDQVRDAFEPFTRFDLEGEGSGLGLAIAKALAELNGGKIVIESPVGRGSEVSLVFPRTSVLQKGKDDLSQTKQQMLGPCADTFGELDLHLRTQQQSPCTENMELTRKVAEPRAEQACVSPSTTGGTEARPVDKTILVIDDDKDTVDLLMRTLERFGFATLGAYSVCEAIGMIQMAAPDVVITDGTMRGGGGKQVLRALRANHLEMPVAVISGRDDRAEREALREAGAQKFFTKPVPFEEVVQWVQSVVGSHAEVPRS